MVHGFAMTYMRDAKDCFMTETGSGQLVITCSSAEILANATAALEQVRLTLLVVTASACIVLMLVCEMFCI